MKHTIFASVFCFSFLPQFENQPIYIPLDVRQVVKNQITKQYKAKFPKRSLEFDELSCPHKGTYSFKNESITLSGADSYWQGTLELPIGSILDGNSIDFPSFETEKNLYTDFAPGGKPANNLKFSSKWVWIGAVLSGIVAGTIIHSQTNNHGAPSPADSASGTQGKGRSLQ
jgi:hypothetical protein